MATAAGKRIQARLVGGPHDGECAFLHEGQPVVIARDIHADGTTTIHTYNLDRTTGTYHYQEQP